MILNYLTFPLPERKHSSVRHTLLESCDIFLQILETFIEIDTSGNKLRCIILIK